MYDDLNPLTMNKDYTNEEAGAKTPENMNINGTGAQNPQIQRSNGVPNGQGYSRVAMPSQQTPGQQMTGQQMTGQQMTGQQMTGQQMQGQQMQGQQMTGQQMQGQQMQRQQIPGQPGMMRNQYGEPIPNHNQYVNCSSQTGTYANHMMQQNKGSSGKPPKKRKSVLGRIWTVAGILATLCFAAFCIVGVIYMIPKITDRDQKNEVTEDNTVSTAEEEMLESKAIDEAKPSLLNNGEVYAVVTDVTDVVDRVMPSVVSINIVYQGSDFFGRVQEYTGSGSGIIIGENETELLIVTNYHVIQDSVNASVLFCDEEEVPAQVKGRDSSMDLAVVAVKLADIKSSTLDVISIAQMGDSDALKVGEPAIAIGNALGYGQSVTTGVISALNRQIAVDTESSEEGIFIQTDAAINPGNSGGALLNVNGEVVGINSNKIGGSTIEGMGYAIPISAAKPILEKLMIKETLEKVDADKQGAIGITGVNVTPDVAQAYGLPNGIYIAQVKEGSAADKAGLLQGDIITEFDGNKVSDMQELMELLEYYETGTTVPLKVKKRLENYEESTIEFQLGSKLELEQSEEENRE